MRRVLENRGVQLLLALLVVGVVYVILNAAFFTKNAAFLVEQIFGHHTEAVAEQDNSAPEPANPVYRDPDTLYIKNLNITLPVIYIDEKGETAYQEALKHGVVHYPGTALPGAYGNVYIFGHSSDYVWSPGDYKTAFALLPHIALGDEIELTDSTGLVYTYAVTDTKIVSPTDLSVLDQGDGTKRMLTLQTSYPVGTALQRFVAIAELLSELSDENE